MISAHVEGLKKVLRSNTALTDLNVGYNNLRSSSKLLGDIILTHNLVSLNISYCQIKGGTRIMKALASSTSLRYLDVSCNNFKSQVRDKIMEIVYHSSRIVSFYAKGNYHPASISVDQLSQLVRSNTSLISLQIPVNISMEPNVCLCELEDLMCVLGKNDSLLSLDVVLRRPTTQWHRLDIKRADVDWKKMTRIFSSNDCMTELKICLIHWNFTSHSRVLWRNKRLWKERAFWSVRVLFLTRMLFFSNIGREILPLEMICHVLWFVPPCGEFRERWMRRVMDHGCDRATLFSEEGRSGFFEFVFGEHFKYLHAKGIIV